MRNLWRVFAFDLAAPAAAIAGLVGNGVVLGWPLWWVSLCSMLCLLIVQGMVVNYVLYRRDGVTMGTDDDGPGLRLAVVAVATATLVAAVLVGYARWTTADRDLRADKAEVLDIATRVAEASATFTPADPNAQIEKATALMTPQRAEAYRQEFTAVAEDLTNRNISGQAQTVSAGVEAIGPEVASVAVIMRGTQNAPARPPDHAVLALRVALVKTDGRWLVEDVLPINAR